MIEGAVAALRALAAARGWEIVEARDIPYGAQLRISDGQTTVPVSLCHTGRRLVQGPLGPLRSALEAWSHCPHDPHRHRPGAGESTRPRALPPTRRRGSTSAPAARSSTSCRRTRA